MLTRFSGMEIESVATAATSGINATTIVTGENLPALSVGTTPKSFGMIPASSGAVIPELSSLSIQESEANTFPAAVKDIDIQAVQGVSQINNLKYGAQPKDSGKPIK